MASTCIKMSSDTFPTPGWLSPRISFSRDFPTTATKHETQNKNISQTPDFEFCLNDTVSMLTADELFSDGKLVPSSTRKPMTSDHLPDDVIPTATPKAPRCSSRWKELLGLKKLYQNTNTNLKQYEDQKEVLNNNKNSARSFKNLLQRNSKTNVDSPSMRLPLLNELESDSVTVSARLSLSSSSSSGHDHEDLPRLSLDSDKPTTISSSSFIPPRNGRVRTVKHIHHAPARGGQRTSVRKAVDGTGNVGLTIDSPRMNSSGKIVFQSLERSSSSPSSFNGGPRHRHRGMERSYSANLRVTPVLNVPVCSLGRFPLFCSSQQKKENVGSVGGSKNEKNQNKNRST